MKTVKHVPVTSTDNQQQQKIPGNDMPVISKIIPTKDNDIFNLL